jgi:hypothetical protein
MLASFCCGVRFRKSLMSTASISGEVSSAKVRMLQNKKSLQPFQAFLF